MRFSSELRCIEGRHRTDGTIFEREDWVLTGLRLQRSPALGLGGSHVRNQNFVGYGRSKLIKVTEMPSDAILAGSIAIEGRIRIITKINPISTLIRQKRERDVVLAIEI